MEGQRAARVVGRLAEACCEFTGTNGHVGISAHTAAIVCTLTVALALRVVGGALSLVGIGGAAACIVFYNAADSC